MIITRPRRLNLRALALDAPLPFVVTCAGMQLPWPSANAGHVPTMALCPGCGGYVDACHCDNPCYPPLDWSEDAEPLPPICTTPEAFRLPTLAERLAESIRDDRAP